MPVPPSGIMQMETSDKLNDGLPASRYHRAVLRAESCGTVRASREAWLIPVGSQTSAHGRAPMLLVTPLSGLGRRFNPALKPSVFGPRGVRLGELEREFMSRSVPAVAELVPRDVADVLAARLVRVPLAGAAVQAGRLRFGSLQFSIRPSLTAHLAHYIAYIG